MCAQPKHAVKKFQAIRTRFIRTWEEAKTGQEIDANALLYLDISLDTVLRQLEGLAYQLANIEAQSSAAVVKHSEAPSRRLRSQNSVASPGVSPGSQQTAERGVTGGANDRKHPSSTAEEDTGDSPNKRRTTQDCWNISSASQYKQGTKPSSHSQSSNPRQHTADRSSQRSVVPTPRKSTLLPELPGVETLLRIEQEGHRKNRGRTQLPPLSTLRLPTPQSIMTIMVPPVVAANNSGPGTQHQVAQATLPQGQTAAGAQQYHHQPLPLAFAPGPQDPSIYHHHSLPDPASSSQGQEARHPSTSQGFPGPSQGPNARGEASSSSQTEPSAMTANATSLTPLPRSTAGNTNNVGPLSVADEVILDDGTKFKIIRESKHSTTYQKL